MSDSHKIQYGNHPSQYGVLRAPSHQRNSPVIVSIHGGFWRQKYDLDENTPLTIDLTERGYATWNIEYRRTDEIETWKDTCEDVIDAINHLDTLQDEYSLDLSRVILIGHSAGGHLALWAASCIDMSNAEYKKRLITPIKGVVSLAGVADLGKMWTIHTKNNTDSPVSTFVGGTPKEVPDDYHSASPIEQLPLNVKQVLIHGKLDQHVPVDVSIGYHDKASSVDEDIELIILPEAEHFKIVNPDTDEWQTVVEAIQKL
ncbi:alpha/beta hydrolase [Salinicoccus sesuvii]|uniref:alpha/beta hydrolase family protein n=1 Tax=Salinicoccus sesuvii TaxID=868281 RepID=UPI0036D34B79